MMKTLNTYTDKEKKEYIEEYRNSNFVSDYIYFFDFLVIFFVLPYIFI